MRKAPAAASKPKPRARARAKPKAKPSPDSLSSATSPSRSRPRPPLALLAGDAQGQAPPLPVRRIHAGLRVHRRRPEEPRRLEPRLAQAPPRRAPRRLRPRPRGLPLPNLQAHQARLPSLAHRSCDVIHRLSSVRAVQMQTQSCLKLAEEAEKERKEMAERISGRAEEMKASYKKFLTEVQSSSSRASKVTFPEMAKSVARAIDGLRSRYNIPATPA